jgi:hypothetical protein
VKLAELAGAPGRIVMLMGEVGSGGYGQQNRQQREGDAHAARAIDKANTYSCASTAIVWSARLQKTNHFASHRIQVTNRNSRDGLPL